MSHKTYFNPFLRVAEESFICKHTFLDDINNVIDGLSVQVFYLITLSHFKSYYIAEEYVYLNAINSPRATGSN